MKLTRPALVRPALLAAAALALSPTHAAEPAAPAGVLNLSASASTEVTHDILVVTFTTAREGSDAASVQSGLKQAVEAALAEARKVAKPEQIDVSTGSFSLYPRYSSKGQPSGWTGTAELVVQGKDLAGIGQLTGRISTMTVGRVAYALSKEARERVEAEVTERAIAQYRARAEAYAKQFGYGGVVIREVQVSSNEPQHYAPVSTRAMAKAEAYDAALPVEPGKGTVSVTVTGSVQMK